MHLRPYSRYGRGEFAIGDFKGEATWTERGEKLVHEWNSSEGSRSSEGTIRTVEFEILFDRIDAEQAKALRAALSNRPEGDHTRYNFALNGEPRNEFYLHEILKGETLMTPRGLIFSNELP